MTYDEAIGSLFERGSDGPFAHAIVLKFETKQIVVMAIDGDTVARWESLRNGKVSRWGYLPAKFRKMPGWEILWENQNGE